MAGAAPAPITATDPAQDPAAWKRVMGLSCSLVVEFPLPGFTVGDLLRLQKRSVIDSHWHIGTDVPLRVNGELVAYGEFEVVGSQLAVRVTELA